MKHTKFFALAASLALLSIGQAQEDETEKSQTLLSSVTEQPAGEEEVSQTAQDTNEVVPVTGSEEEVKKETASE